MIRLWDHCPSAWRPVVEDLLTGEVGEMLDHILNRDLADGREVFPPIGSVFGGLRSLTLPDVKVVILGQDPYHQPGQATGRAFEVPNGTVVPPSLRNILKLLEKDIGPVLSTQNLFDNWESEGVLLLNTVLTVRKGQPESHQNMGWEVITDRIIQCVASSGNPTVFFLWGAEAQKKARLLEDDQNLVLKAPHPSPLSAYRGFFDCQHFSLANEWLSANGQSPIQWLPD